MDRFDDRETRSKAIDAYLHGLEVGDGRGIPFAADVRFLGPAMNEPIAGRDAVAEHISSFGERIDSIAVHEKAISGDRGFVTFAWREVAGFEVEICDYFEFAGGLITYVRAYFDPRPFLESD